MPLISCGQKRGRHTLLHIPLLLLHELVRWDAQFDWTHTLYHTNNWFAIAARHFFDELTLGQNAIEFHIASNFILETAFTNLQFVGLAPCNRYFAGGSLRTRQSGQ